MRRTILPWSRVLSLVRSNKNAVVILANEAPRRAHSHTSIAHQPPLTNEDLEKSLRFLDPKDAEIIRILASGSSNAEIAGALGMKIRTVRARLSNLYDRLEVVNRTELIVALMERGHDNTSPSLIR